MRSIRHLLFAAAMLGHAASIQAAPSFQIIVANDFVGGSVSADGSTVAFSQASASASAGTFDVATGQRTDFGLNANSVHNTAISADGSIIHGSLDDGLSELYEFSNGTLNFVGFSDRRPLALSDDGSTAAGFLGLQATRTTGGISGTTIVLDDLPGGGTTSRAYDISGDGSVLVGEGSSTSGTEAFRWEAGVTVGLGDLPGGNFASRAYGVSNDGTTVVGSATTANGTEAFRWRDGTMVSLGGLPGGTVSSEALSVSGDGSVAVGFARDAGSQSEAFIWDSTHGMRSLAVLLSTLGVDLQNVDLHSAESISADGRTIVGTGFQHDVYPDPNSPQSIPGLGTLVWVAVVPEPTTAMLLGVGLCALSYNGRTRRHAI